MIWKIINAIFGVVARWMTRKEYGPNKRTLRYGGFSVVPWTGPRRRASA